METRRRLPLRAYDRASVSLLYSRLRRLYVRRCLTLPIMSYAPWIFLKCSSSPVLGLSGWYLMERRLCAFLIVAKDALRATPSIL